jgi:hypothetical protein
MGCEWYINGVKVTNGSRTINPTDTIKIITPAGFGLIPGGGLEVYYEGPASGLEIIIPMTVDEALESEYSPIPSFAEFLQMGCEWYINGVKVTNGSTIIRPADTIKILVPSGFDPGGELEEVFNGLASEMMGITTPITVNAAFTFSDPDVPFSSFAGFLKLGCELYINGVKVTDGSTIIRPADRIRILVPSGFGPVPESPGLEPGVVPESNAQVYHEDGSAYTGNSTVYARIWTADLASLIELPAGSITAGKLTLNLPSTIDDTYLTSADIYEMLGYTVTPHGLRLTEVSLGIVAEDGYRNSLSFQKDSGTDSYGVNYLYCSQAGTITGTVDYYGSFIENINITAKAGWNRVYWRLEQGNGTQTYTVTSDLSSLPGDLKWTIIPDYFVY